LEKSGVEPQNTVNPLLDFSGLPRYGLVRPEHVASAVDQLLAENRALITRLTAEGAAASWNGFAEPLEDANERLWRAWGVVAHLHAVDDSAAIRDAYNANLPKITRYRTELAQNLDLYEKFKALRASPDLRSCLKPSARSSRTTCATIVWEEPNWDLGTSNALAKSRKNLLRSKPSFPRICSTQPMPFQL